MESPAEYFDFVQSIRDGLAAHLGEGREPVALIVPEAVYPMFKMAVWHTIPESRTHKEISSLSLGDCTLMILRSQLVPPYSSKGLPSIMLV